MAVMADLLLHAQVRTMSFDLSLPQRIRQTLVDSSVYDAAVHLYEPEVTQDLTHRLISAGVSCVSAHTHYLLNSGVVCHGDKAAQEIVNLAHAALDIFHTYQPIHGIAPLVAPRMFGEAHQEVLEMLCHLYEQCKVDALVILQEDSCDDKKDAPMYTSELSSMRSIIESCRIYTNLPLIAVLPQERVVYQDREPFDDERWLHAARSMREAGADIVVMQTSASAYQLHDILLQAKEQLDVPIGLLWEIDEQMGATQVVDAVLTLAPLELALMGLGSRASLAQVAACAHAIRYLI